MTEDAYRRRMSAADPASPELSRWSVFSDGRAWKVAASPRTGSDNTALVDRLEKLRLLVPVFAHEAVSARREAARLRSENLELKRRIAELEGDA
jgi:hypothetical protein